MHDPDLREIETRRYVVQRSPFSYAVALIGLAIMFGGLALFGWVTRQPLPYEVYVTVVVGATPEILPTLASTSTPLPKGDPFFTPTPDPLVGVPYCYEPGVKINDVCVPRHAPTAIPTYAVCTPDVYTIPIELLREPCLKEGTPSATPTQGGSSPVR